MALTVNGLNSNNSLDKLSHRNAWEGRKRFGRKKF